MFLSFLLRFWPYILAASVIIGIITYIVSLRHENQSLTKQVFETNLKLQVSNDSINLLKGNIDEQNASIKVFKDAADERFKKAQVELLQAKNTANELKKQSTSILLKQRKQNETSCDAANRIINESLLK